jgi:hypothetical protein
VIDVASAIMASLKDDGASMGKIYELGGPQVMTVHELVRSHSLITLLHYCMIMLLYSILYLIRLPYKK